MSGHDEEQFHDHNERQRSNEFAPLCEETNESVAVPARTLRPFQVITSSNDHSLAATPARYDDRKVVKEDYSESRIV